MHAQPRKVGMIFGFALSLYHVVWAILVAIGVGQWLVDFIFWAHMFHMDIIVGPFDWTATITLIIVTFVVGYVMGYIGSLIWNRVHK